MKTLTPIALLALLALVASAQRLVVPAWRLVWDDPNPPSASRTYNVWRHLGGTNYTHITNVSTTHWVINLPPGLHTVAVSVVESPEVETEVSTNHVFATLVTVVNLRVTQ